MASAFLAAGFAPGVQRAPGRGGVESVLGRWRHGDTPAQLVVLDVTLAQLVRHLRPRELDAEVEGVGTVLLDAKPGVQVERVAGDVMAVAVVGMDAVLGDLD